MALLRPAQQETHLIIQPVRRVGSSFHWHWFV
jgi:hypothetical protein